MKKINIHDKDIINTFIKEYQIITSEISFTNLFAWRNKYNFHYIILDNFLWIINNKDNKYYLSQPIGDYRNIEGIISSINSMKKFLKNRPFIIKKSDDKFLKLLNELPFSYSYSSNRDDSDYIYDFKKMQTLSGNRYHKKKNHVNQFLKKYTWHYNEISELNLMDIDEICKIWFEGSHELSEYDAIKDVLENFKKLDVQGGILYVENKAVAFTIGEALNNDTHVIHFEKAVSGYTSLYPMIFYKYVNTLMGYKYVNREQDLGFDGLRKSKLSYHPVKLIEKYTIRIGDK